MLAEIRIERMIVASSSAAAAKRNPVLHADQDGRRRADGPL
jgi:hypothetical protein